MGSRSGSFLGDLKIPDILPVGGAALVLMLAALDYLAGTCLPAIVPGSASRFLRLSVIPRDQLPPA